MCWLAAVPREFDCVFSRLAGAEREYVIEEDFMKVRGRRRARANVCVCGWSQAARKMQEGKKLEGKLEYTKV